MVTLDLPDGRRLAVRGQVDRLDRWADGRLVVTDHKTGKADRYAKLDASDPTLDGSVFQLPVYAAAVLARAAAAAATSTTSMGELPLFAPSTRCSNVEVPSASGSISTMRSGPTSMPISLMSSTASKPAGFRSVPERPGFRMFVGCPYCEPDGLGTDDAFERWVRKQHDPRIARWFGVTEENDGDG